MPISRQFIIIERREKAAFFRNGLLFILKILYNKGSIGSLRINRQDIVLKQGRDYCL